MGERQNAREKNFWDLTGLDANMSRPVTQDDIEMVKSQWPSLELVAWRTPNDQDDEDGVLETLTSPDDSPGAPAFLTAKDSMWTIQYWVGNESYPTAMSSSSSEHLFGGQSEEGSGSGTIAGESFATAINMIELAQQQGWPGVQILSGSENMKWAAWAACDTLNIPCLGYDPTPEATAKAERVKEILNSKLLDAGKTASKTLGKGSSSDEADEDK